MQIAKKSKSVSMLDLHPIAYGYPKYILNMGKEGIPFPWKSHSFYASPIGEAHVSIKQTVLGLLHPNALL